MKNELTFEIDKKESEAVGMLALVSSIPLSLSGIGRLACGKEAAQFLYQQEINYLKRGGKGTVAPEKSMAIFHVAYPQTVEALKLLAAAGLLRYRGKTLACDFFGKSKFYYHIESHSDNRVTISGRLKYGSQEFPIEECDFVCGGSPHWYIKGIVLRMISTDISWSDLHQALSSPAEISLKHLERIYGEDSESDPDAPKLVFLGERPEKSIDEPSILPLLVLQDRMGAFANLFMEYHVPRHDHSNKIAFHDYSTWVKDASGRQLFKRQTAAEVLWEKDLLETDFIRKNVGATHYYCPIDKVAKSLTFLLEVGWKIVDSLGNQLYRFTKSSFTIDTNPEAFVVKGKIHYDHFETNLNNVVGAFNRRERFVQLGGGAIGLLPEKGFGDALTMVLEDGEIVKDGIQVSRSRFGTLAAALNADKNIVGDCSLIDLKEKLLSFHGIEERLPGPSFSGVLRPYQQAGVNWLAFLYEHHFNGLLADDMGLGKTVQVLAFISQVTTTHPILFVLPTSLIFNWLREIERFLPGLSVTLHHGAERSRDVNQLSSAKILLTSYTTLRLDLNLFQQLQFECIVLDEAQVIKNAHTQTAQALYKLKGRFRLSLSGTPVENHLGEMWAHFRFLMPELFGSEQEFLSDVAAGSLDPRHLQKIRRKMMPFFLRRDKKEVAKELPERIEQVVWVEMADQQRQIYEDFLAGFKGNLFKKVEVDGLSRHRMEVLEAILRLRQICCHPLLAIPHSEKPLPSAKTDMLLEDIETAIEEGAKILVYSQFTSMLTLIAKEVKERQWRYTYLDGSTRDRETVVNQFQKDPAIPLFLISLKAGGVGLNLTAADYVFIYDPWWNESAENQAIDRAHRIGRKTTVIAKRYAVVESIEEKIMRLKAAKKSMIDAIIDEDLGKLDLTIDDLRFLMS